jgi:hypothetical protein
MVSLLTHVSRSFIAQFRWFLVRRVQFRVPDVEIGNPPTTPNTPSVEEFSSGSLDSAIRFSRHGGWRGCGAETSDRVLTDTEKCLAPEISRGRAR